MLKLAPYSLGIAAGGLLVRERRARISAERLGAATLETLLNAIDANDGDTGAHVRRVATYALILCDAAGFDYRTCSSVERVALFHDIGKIHEALSDIFHESTKLTPAERRAVMTHPQRGADVLSPLARFYPDLSRGVLSHHERWDGHGYPKHLKGKRIPIEARVVAIADTFDAITHSRRYSQARSVEFAKEVIAEGRGTQFDPELTDLFLSPPVIDQVEAKFRVAMRPKRKTRRNLKKMGDPIPDLRFRWRIARGGRPLRGR
ncbi:MAG TPA: HD domain-containing phosphohydrolase [Gemmatimonadaceae bacterium]|jgi:HD-GYP domain-containing protein (c-di-GMP phosphodiesterase class II)|nr:HD domain-containing phosphohydrolase [Gemmatimonadaceae bacterium]